MSFKSLLILVYSLAGLLIALFSAFMTYLIIGEPIGMKMLSKISLVVVAALPVIALISYGVGKYFFGKFEGIRYRLDQIAHGDFVSIEPQEHIFDVERIHHSITLLSERLSELIESLQKQNETVSNMTLSLAHDIKTPLMIINGYLEEIRDGLISPEALPSLVDKMRSECGYIDDLTNDVLEYLSSINPNREREQVVIYDVVYEILSLIPLSPNTHWNIDLPREAVIEFNRMDLKKVLMNLLHNSAKFTAYGVITIRIDDNKIIIEDTGCGIDPQFFSRLFEPYSTADTSRNRQKSGLGLGLSITKNLVLNNGYDIEFDELVAVGARVMLDYQNS
ncbi:MAG: sensor histidine kinase [Sulfuricurvum sp.]